MRSKPLESPPNRVRELRIKQGLTLEKLAEEIGMAFAHLQRIETGKRDLSLGWMTRIARELGVRPADLLNSEDGGLGEAERQLVETVREVPEISRNMFYTLMEAQQGYRGEPEHERKDARLDDRKSA